MSNYCEIGNCPNRTTKNHKGKNICEIHYAQEKGHSSKIEFEQVRKCEVCGYKALNKWGEKERLIEHHISYQPEETILVCDRCHQEIHNNPDHEYAPTEKQLWKAEKTVRKSDVRRLTQVGKVRFSYKKSSQIHEGYFVHEHGLLGFLEEGDQKPVWNVRRSINRSDIEFVEQKPWNLANLECEK